MSLKPALQPPPRIGARTRLWPTGRNKLRAQARAGKIILLPANHPGQHAMRPRSWSLSAHLTAGTLLGVLAWGLLAPAPARASCGDYVTMQPQHGSPPYTAPQHSTPGDTRPVSPVPPPPADDLPQPCPGPSCSTPTAPEPATAPAPVRPSEDWAVPAWALQITPPIPGDALREPARAPRARRPSTVYRPPRFSRTLQAAC
jgi:hypothetical protein